MFMQFFMQSDRLSELGRTRNSGIFLFCRPFSKLTARRIVQLRNIKLLAMGGLRRVVRNTVDSEETNMKIYAM